MTYRWKRVKEISDRIDIFASPAADLIVWVLKQEN